MKRFEAEVDSNYDRFRATYTDAAVATAASLVAHREKYLESYRRLVSLQAWRSELLETAISTDSFAFFLEAQNDALTSHVQASFGAWRSALKSLRSCIENVLFSMYYKDHPIELQLWHAGKHRLNFSEMESYFKGHPAIAKIPENARGLDLLGSQYPTLSRAVHGSAKSFRMSIEGIGIQLWSDDKIKLGKWGTNERDTIMGINRLLMGLFCEHLHDSRLPNLRKAISLVIPVKQQAGIKQHFGINLFA